MPILEVNEKQLTSSIGIARMIAEENGETWPDRCTSRVSKQCMHMTKSHAETTVHGVLTPIVKLCLKILEPDIHGCMLAHDFKSVMSNSVWATLDAHTYISTTFTKADHALHDLM